MQDEQTNTTETPIKKIPRQRHFLAVFFLSFMWGTFGVDRFYLGKVGTGILKLVSFGGFGLWTLIDMVIIMTGTMKDKQGREMLQVAEYKKFAGRTVLIFAITLGLVILISGLLSILGIYVLLTSIMDGQFTNLLPEGLQNLVPGGSQFDLQNGDLEQQLRDANL